MTEYKRISFVSSLYNQPAKARCFSSLNTSLTELACFSAINSERTITLFFSRPESCFTNEVYSSQLSGQTTLFSNNFKFSFRSLLQSPFSPSVSRHSSTPPYPYPLFQPPILLLLSLSHCKVGIQCNILILKGTLCRYFLL